MKRTLGISAFALLLVSSIASLAMADTTLVQGPKRCNLELLNADLKAGKVTESLLTPSEYLGNPKTADGRPRFILTIAVPGAGKSTWSKAATHSDWTVVENDAIRQRLLRELKAEGGKVEIEIDQEVDGKMTKVKIEQEPDPVNPLHLFSPKYQPLGIKLGEEAVAQALREGKSIIFDAVNGNLTRAKMINLARAHGYEVEALVFQTDNVQNHIDNVALRASKGGIFLAPAIIQNIWNAVNLYSSELRVDPNLREPTADLPAINMGQIFGLAGAKNEAGLPKFTTLDEAIASLSPEEQTVFTAYVNADVFNRVEFVWVPNFAQLK